MSRAAAGRDGAVRIECPEVGSERAAEIESRAQASLLTSELSVDVSIECDPGGASLRVAGAGHDIDVRVETPATEESFREDVLRALDQALEQLRERVGQVTAPDPQPAAPKTSATPPESAGAALAPPPRAPPLRALPPPPAPAHPARPSLRAHGEASLAVLGEVWGERLALGGAFRLARQHPRVGYGLTLGVLRPLTLPESFGATEAHAAAELALVPGFARGARASLDLGASTLFVTPSGGLSARSGTARTVLFVAARVTFPLSLGRVWLVPGAGARLFSAERGVRVASQSELALRGLAPQLSLALSFRN